MLTVTPCFVFTQGSLTVEVIPHLGHLPGNTLHITGLLQAADSSGQTVYVQIYNPQGALAHQDLTSTITAPDGSYSKNWTLPSSAPSGRWQIAVAWSQDVLVQDIADFIVGCLTIEVNETLVSRYDGLHFTGLLEGNGNAGQSIHLQILDSMGTIAYQNIDELVTNETGSFELDWLVPGFGSTGWWSVVVAWASNNLINGQSRFCVKSDIVDTSPPVLNHPDDVSYSEGTTGHWLIWNPTDLNPFSYEILRNGDLLLAGYWNSSAEPISICIDGLSIGEYNYTVTVVDAFSNTASDSVSVTVEDVTAPEVDHPDDREILLGEEGHFISWHPSDTHPDSYTIFLEDIQIRAGSWNSSEETITVSLDYLTIGLHNYTLLVRDTTGNAASDTVLITVIEEDITPPIIDSLSDIEINEGTTGVFLTWHPSDAHPSTYEILRNEIRIGFGVWNSSLELIIVSLDGLLLGTYNFTLIVTDVGNNRVADSVLVFVLDGTPPELDHPPDVEFLEGTTGHVVTWYPFDLHPSTYEILKDGHHMRSGAWNSSLESISISLDELQGGTYNFTLVVSDAGGNIAWDSVQVVVIPTTTTTTPPVTTTTSPVTTTGPTITTTPFTPPGTDTMVVIFIMFAGALLILVMFIIVRRRLTGS